MSPAQASQPLSPGQATQPPSPQIAPSAASTPEANKSFDISLLLGDALEPGHRGQDIFNNPNTQPFLPDTNHFYG